MATNKPHTLADHLHGVDREHDADHDHEHDVPIEENALWLQDNINRTLLGQTTFSTS
jgi:hypothetical protein